jgi:uncharacterized protein YyaL (SSP411 family)
MTSLQVDYADTVRTTNGWFPHFEKMLYDNALYIRSRAYLFSQKKRRFYKDAVENVCDFILSKIMIYGYYAAIDADKGVEGTYG